MYGTAFPKQYFRGAVTGKPLFVLSLPISNFSSLQVPFSSLLSQHPLNKKALVFFSLLGKQISCLFNHQSADFFCCNIFSVPYILIALLRNFIYLSKHKCMHSRKYILQTSGTHVLTGINKSILFLNFYLHGIRDKYFSLPHFFSTTVVIIF